MFVNVNRMNILHLRNLDQKMKAKAYFQKFHVYLDSAQRKLLELSDSTQETTSKLFKFSTQMIFDYLSSAYRSTVLKILRIHDNVNYVARAIVYMSTQIDSSRTCF